MISYIDYFEGGVAVLSMYQALSLWLSFMQFMMLTIGIIVSTKNNQPPNSPR